MKGRYLAYQASTVAMLCTFVQAFSHAAGSKGPQPQPTVFLKTYGCQMNVSDSELVTSILRTSGYTFASAETDADVILLNTCAIRDGAEQKVWGKLRQLKSTLLERQSRQPVIGILGCMAERLKDRLLESQLVQVVAGAYTIDACTEIRTASAHMFSYRS